MKLSWRYRGPVRRISARFQGTGPQRRSSNPPFATRHKSTLTVVTVCVPLVQVSFIKRPKYYVREACCIFSSSDSYRIARPLRQRELMPGHGVSQHWCSFHLACRPKQPLRCSLLPAPPPVWRLLYIFISRSYVAQSHVSLASGKVAVAHEEAILLSPEGAILAERIICFIPTISLVMLQSTFSPRLLVRLLGRGERTVSPIWSCLLLSLPAVKSPSDPRARL